MLAESSQKIVTRSSPWTGLLCSAVVKEEAAKTYKLQQKECALASRLRDYPCLNFLYGYSAVDTWPYEDNMTFSPTIVHFASGIMSSVVTAFGLYAHPLF